MVACQHDDGVATAWVAFQRIEKASDLGVDECHGSEVGLKRLVPELAFNDVLVVTETVVHVLVGMGTGQLAGEFRHIIPVIAFGGFGRTLDGIDGKLIEPRGGYLERAVGTEKANRHEEWLVRLGVPLVDGPARDLVIAHFFVRSIEGITVSRRTVGVEGVFPFWRLRVAGFLEKGIPVIAWIAMKHLAAAGNAVAVLHEELLHRGRFNLGLFLELGVEIGAGVRGILAVVQAGSGGAALRGVAVGVRESHAALSQGIHVRRNRVGVTAEVTEVVVEIVDNDEDDVRMLIGFLAR